jgi:hypothetical protein
MTAVWTSFLSRLRIGPCRPLADHGVTLVSIIDVEPTPIEAFPLRWGIEHGRTRVTEVGDGRVDRVRVEHTGATPILVLDGEEVIGAKQNRVFNASFIVPPGGVVELPVSCVEQKRWSQQSSRFSSTGRTVITQVRTTKLERVATSVIRRGEYDAGQQEVWTGVSRYLERTQVTSRTAAYADAADRRMERVDATIEQLELEAGQVGVAAVSATGTISLDVFGSPGLLNKSWWSVARGLLCDVGDGELQNNAAAAVDSCLRQLAAVEPHRAIAPGLGESLYAVAPSFVAGAVAYDQRLYHLLAATRHSDRP